MPIEPKNEDPDRELVALAKAGNKSSFQELINRHYQFVFSIAFGVVHERQTALDITQDVFLKLFKDLRLFEFKSKFKTWLYRIAYNASIDQVRKIKPHELIETNDAISDEGTKGMILPDLSESARDKIFNEEVKNQIQEALNQLSPDQRAILVLREWQEMSYEEIAQILQIEIGTVMSRLHYARKKLADVLKKGAFQDYE